jgi:hypothetical protein
MGETIHLVNDKIENFYIFIEFILVDFDKNLYMSQFPSKLP